MEGIKVGGRAGGYERGFTHTWNSLDRLKVEDELEQVTHGRNIVPATAQLMREAGMARKTKACIVRTYQWRGGRSARCLLGSWI